MAESRQHDCGTGGRDLQAAAGQWTDRQLWNGKLLSGGNADIYQQDSARFRTDSAEGRKRCAEAGKDAAVFCSRMNSLLGIIAVADVIKEDSPQAVQELQNMGIRCGDADRRQ